MTTNYTPWTNNKNNIIDTHSLIKLNIACGPNVFPYDGWINYDHQEFKEYFHWLRHVVYDMSLTSPNLYHSGLQVCLKEVSERPQQRALLDYLLTGKDINVIAHDLNNGFIQHQNDSVDFIYAGQAIEHLNRLTEAPKFLNECRRILKPNGILRMTTPDLDLLIKAYLNNEMDKFSDDQPEFYKTLDQSGKLSAIMFGASGANCTAKNFEGHFFLYTQKSMTQLLQENGFREIEFYYESNKGKNTKLANECVDIGLSHSFIVEAIK